MAYSFTKSICMTQTTTTLKKQENRGQLVNSRHVDILISNYKKNRWRDNSSKIGKPDSLSSWYGLQELQEFLELAKENNADGIKMYFGEYPEDYEQTREYQKMQTVVLVATRKSKSAKGIVNKDIQYFKNGKWEILGFNMSAICPPDCITQSPGENGMDSIDFGFFTN